ncbi:hypothetical protein BC937DRAFT_86908 [Endogone sp. FLAS-F59071]|nr:hypothetical protein BC937DRAFT_86908 [Endogone sp. FLAS-F59071]|eukprot:RUS12828.1 hypothetical protein BC937DRAFT_86908 [Endogone sp. FLAS-F59071]
MEKGKRNTYPILYVRERCWLVDSKAYQDDVGLGVGQWPKSVVVLLAGCVPQGQLDCFTVVELDHRNVVFKDGWNIFLCVEEMWV